MKIFVLTVVVCILKAPVVIVPRRRTKPQYDPSRQKLLISHHPTGQIDRTIDQNLWKNTVININQSFRGAVLLFWSDRCRIVQNTSKMVVFPASRTCRNNIKLKRAQANNKNIPLNQACKELQEEYSLVENGRLIVEKLIDLSTTSVSSYTVVLYRTSRSLPA